MKKAYQSHTFKTRNELLTEFQKGYVKKDRFYMAEMMKPIIIYLDKFGVKNYQDFYHLMHNYGFRSNDFTDMITEFKDFINSINTNSKIEWIKKRELKKSNYCEKNIILNRLVVEYQHEMIEFFKIYAFKKMNGSINAELLLNDFKAKISEINNQITKQIQIDAFLQKFK